MKIYTKTGDRGDTGLFGGARVSKASTRVTAYGEVDELNSVIGLVLSEPFDAGISALLIDVQSRLFDVGAELATAPDSKIALGIPLIGEPEVETMPLTGCRSFTAWGKPCSTPILSPRASCAS